MEPVVATLADLFRGVHHQLRDEIKNLDSAGLRWTPGPNTSAVATLVAHVLGAEREALMMARGLDAARDRDSEFQPTDESPKDLLRRIDAADRLLEEYAAKITAADLAAMRERAVGGTNTGLYWLLRAFGHSREHLAQAELTSQLYEQQRTHAGIRPSVT